MFDAKALLSRLGTRGSFMMSTIIFAISLNKEYIVLTNIDGKVSVSSSCMFGTRECMLVNKMELAMHSLVHISRKSLDLYGLGFT